MITRPMIDSPPSLSSPVNSSSRYVEVCCAYPCGDPCPTTPYQTDGPNTRAHPFLKCRSILRPQVPHYRSQTQSRHRERLASAPIGMTVSLAIACRWGASDRQHASVSASADEYLYCLLYLRRARASCVLDSRAGSTEATGPATQLVGVPGDASSRTPHLCRYLASSAMVALYCFFPPHESDLSALMLPPPKPRCQITDEIHQQHLLVLNSQDVPCLSGSNRPGVPVESPRCHP